MKLIIHDLFEDQKDKYLKVQDIENTILVERSEKMPVKCIGCFGCWVKNPGECMIKDGYHHMGKYIGNCEEFYILTDSKYGEFSVFSKSIIDRCISAIHPHFVKRNGEVHHKLRYDNAPVMNVICYSDDMTDAERETFKGRVAAMGLNLGVSKCNVSFTNGLVEMSM